MPLSFAELGLPTPVIDALRLGDIVEPTPVQSAVIPDALAGHDVLGRAQTGSGKTLAFGIPVVARLAGEKSRMHRPRAIIIVPTRELATQVERSLAPVAKAMRLRLVTVYGGSPYERQIKALRQGVDIVVATPGRLGDLIERGNLRTDDVQVTVLDEADHLCDLGFYPIVDSLLQQTPAGAQRMLLSATLDGDVDRLVKKHLRNPRLHELDPSSGSVTTMTHHVMVVGGFAEKIDAAAGLVEAAERSIVFVRTREGATELRDAFAKRGISAVDLHGNLTQRVREKNLARFKQGDAKVVVATDVAARGIHVDGIGLVVHFDAPTDPKAYLHRSGRTARAGEDGAVMTLTVRKRLEEVRRLQRTAGVDAKLHDFRSVPRPLSMVALDAIESTVFARDDRDDRPRAGGTSRPVRSGGYQGRPRGAGAPRPQRDGAGSSRREWSPERPARGERPARADRVETAERPARPGKHQSGSRPVSRSAGQPGAAKKARWSGPEKRSR